MERLGDRITGAAGPVFVTLAVVLLSLGVFCFFEVIQPTLRWSLFTLPLNLLIASNLVGQYYYACTVHPGFIEDLPRTEGTGLFWARRRRGRHYGHGHGGYYSHLPSQSQSQSQTESQSPPLHQLNMINGIEVGAGESHSGDSGSERGGATPQGVRWTLNVTRAHTSRCKRCGQMRPERAHHCRICNRCVLKYDHHCPVWINQCVGIYNERHFVLFMAYLVLSTFCLAVLGYEKAWEALGFAYMWSYWTPAIVFCLIYILSVVMCFAVGAMLSWHLWSVCKAETSVESHDYNVYRRYAKDRGQSFENSYDLGLRKNLEVFFNVGEDGYPYYTLLLPLRVMPYTDGRSWARRPGYSSHKGIEPHEELTDEDYEDDEIDA